MNLNVRVIRSRELIRLWEHSGANPEVPFDVLKTGIVVYLGSSLSMRALRDRVMPGLSVQRRYLFRQKNGRGRRQAELYAVDDHKRSYSYVRGEQRDTDIAHVAVLPSEDRRPIVFAAGISTIGTEAAARFLCTDTHHDTEMRNLQVLEGEERRLRPFEVVMKVDVVNERPDIRDADVEPRG